MLHLKKQLSISKFFVFLIIILVSMGCQNELLEVQEDEDAFEDQEAVIEETVVFQNSKGDSIRISISDDGVVFLIGTSGIEGNNNSQIVELITAYNNNECDLADLYRTFTGRDEVPDNVTAVNSKIQAMESIVEDDEGYTEIVEPCVAVDANSNNFRSVSTYEDIYEINISGKDFENCYSFLRYCWTYRTGNAKVELKTNYMNTAAYCYRGIITHKMRYKKSGWKAGPINAVPAGYFSYMSVRRSAVIANWMKAEVTDADGDGYHIAIGD